jgi:hypothetical protein
MPSPLEIVSRRNTNPGWFIGPVLTVRVSVPVSHPIRSAWDAPQVDMVASGPTEKTEMGEFKLLRDQLWWEAGQEFA